MIGKEFCEERTSKTSQDAARSSEGRNGTTTDEQKT